MDTNNSGAEFTRRYPIGAEIVAGGGVHFRVWAPARREVRVVLEPRPINEATAQPVIVSLAAEGNGYFSGVAPEARQGSRYRFALDDERLIFPDPASRFQPDGVHGPSEVVDPSQYVWRHGRFPGQDIHGQVIYELHIGSFTPDGTFQAAIKHLQSLAELGVTLIEVMPVAEFNGRFGWGYDGVNLFAPTRLYGQPDDFRAFIDAAHGLGMGVLLDVVYNHFGPVGNYVGMFSKDYASTRHKTEWGEALNFDGDNCGGVREFFLTNCAYWIEEFRLDGLRLDATQAIYDDSEEHMVAAIVRVAHEAAGGHAFTIAENERQTARTLHLPSEGGFGVDAAWNDDFHHSARVAMSGHSEFYYSDYCGTPQELISAIKYGYLYQGQWNRRQKLTRGTPCWGLPAKQFVTFLCNHDQVANSAQGLRPHLLTSPGRFRAMTALMLLAPATPMLFQGQEFSASSPFLYFADQEVDVAKLVREGRQEFLRQFRSLSAMTQAEHFVDPCDPHTFERCKLDHAERERNSTTWRLHCDLLRLRRGDPTFSSQDADRLHCAVLTDEAFLLRFRGNNREDRILIVNLGKDLRFTPSAEPLLAPPLDCNWQQLWTSEDPKYGGAGLGVLDVTDWHFPGHAAVVLASRYGNELPHEDPPGGHAEPQTEAQP